MAIIHFLLKCFSFPLAWLRDCFRWLFAQRVNLSLITVIVAIAVVIMLTQRISTRTKERDQAQHDRNAEQTAHTQTIANYIEAQAVATQKQADNIARVKAEQAIINKGVVNDYENDIAGLRLRADQLRQQLASAKAAGGVASGAAMPAALPATSQIDGAASQEGLSDPAIAFLPMDIDDRLLASEQAAQLDALITLIEKQSAVVTSAEVPR